MDNLLILTNAEAANTLALVAWVLTFFIALNAAILVYTIIRNARAAKKRMNDNPSVENESNVSLTSRAPKKPDTGKGTESTDGDDDGFLPEGTFQISLTDLANPERTFYAEGKSAYLVGRRPQMDLCIPDDGYVSGTHCKFELVEGDLFLTDLESSNGTKVNGVKITEKTKVTEKDVVRIGKMEYRVNY